MMFCFCSNRIRTLVAMATYSFHWHNVKREKWKLTIFAVSMQRFRLFFLQKCFLSSPLGFIWILSKSLDLLGCHGNINGKFSKKLFKIFSSEIIGGEGGWNWNLAYIFLTLASKWIMFLLSLHMCFHCYGNLKFPWTYNGKSENWHLFLCYCRYFDRKFSEMFL